MLRIKEMTIFSISLEILDKSPRALAKIWAGYSSCHSAPVVPHSKYTNLSLLTLIIHKQHKGWNRAGWSLFMAPKCFIPLKMCPKLIFFLPRSQTKCLSLFQPWVALQCGCYNHSICLILRVQIWHKTQPIKDFLNPGNEWSGGKQWRRMVRAVWLRGHPAQFALLWRKRQVMASKISIPSTRTHQIHLLSPIEKKKELEDINLIGLSRRCEKSLLLIGWGAQNKRGERFQPGWPELHCAFSPMSRHWKCVFLLQNVTCFTVAILCNRQRLMEH